MTTELIMTLVGIVAAPIASGLTAIFMRRKYRVEIDGLRAEVSKTQTETRSTELSNVREGVKILMDDIVRPLEKQIKRLNTNVARFEKAIAKIPACPHSASCPVTPELLGDEARDDDRSAGGK